MQRPCCGYYYVCMYKYIYIYKYIYVHIYIQYALELNWFYGYCYLCMRHYMHACAIYIANGQRAPARTQREGGATAAGHTVLNYHYCTLLNHFWIQVVAVSEAQRL